MRPGIFLVCPNNGAGRGRHVRLPDLSDSALFERLSYFKKYEIIVIIFLRGRNSVQASYVCWDIDGSIEDRGRLRQSACEDETTSKYGVFSSI